MIRTEREYQHSRTTLAEMRAAIKAQRSAFSGMQLTQEQEQRGLAPLLGLAAQIEAEIEQYERWREGKVRPVTSLDHVGDLLIALRIARGVSQRDLAARLQISEQQVSRDERNQYHGIRVDRAQRIVDALGGSVELRVRLHDSPVEEPALTTAERDGAA